MGVLLLSLWLMCVHALMGEMPIQGILWWPRELYALQIEKKTLQIKKTTSSIWQHTCCKCSQHNQKKETHCKCSQHNQKKKTHCKCSQHNQKKKCAANKIYLVVLWALAGVFFFICLCCKHFHHGICFLICWCFFYLACVSCSALSSLGHRRIPPLWWHTFSGKKNILKCIRTLKECLWHRNTL